MSEATLVLIVLFKSLVTISAIAGAVYLMMKEKEGWGWLIFIALCTASWSLNVTPTL